MFPMTGFGGLLVIMSIVAIVFAGFAWRKRDEAGGRPLTLTLLLLAGSQSSYALELGSSAIGTKFFWLRVSMVFAMGAAIAWTFTAFEYSGRNRWISRRSVGAATVVPAVIAVLLFLPVTREYVITLPREEWAGAIMGESFTPGPLLIVPFLIAFVALGIATALYIQLFLRSRHLYRTQAVAVLTAAVVPWMGYMLQIFGVLTNRDLTGLFLIPSAGLLTLGLYRFRTLDPVPAAHEAIVEAMGNGILVVDVDGRINDSNSSARSLLANGNPSLTGKYVDEVFDAWQTIDTPDEGPSDWQQLTLSDGDTTLYVEVRVAPFSDHHGDTIGRLVELNDVTDREKRERALTRFRTIFEAVSDPVYVLNAADCFTIVNDSFAALLGYDRDDLIGKPFAELVVDETAEDDTLQRRIELTLVTGDGSHLPVETQRTPITTEFEGFGGGSVGFVRDISHRKDVEAELTRTTERYESLVEASPLAIVAFNTEGVVERWNQAATELFGWDPGEVVGEPSPVFPPDEQDRIAEYRQRVFGGERLLDIEVVLERRDGNRFDASFSLAPVFDDDEIHGAVAVITDITDRKERERILEQKNERLDEFASIVSHDLRNPLNVAQGRLEIASDEQASEHLKAASKALDRIETLIDDVLELARQGQRVEDPDSASLDAIAEDAWEMVETTDAGLNLTEEVQLQADPDRLQRLLENLFRNAAEHAGADVQLRVGPLTDRDGFFVADNGSGISPEDRDSVFDSGYTTATDGTGFGLSIVETIAEAHDWTIGLNESAEGGARFEFETGPYGERQG